jgi:hypothetical protein
MIRADIKLPESIVPASTSAVVSRASSVFLTGATGFLGVFLLIELLRAYEGQVRYSQQAECTPHIS